MKIQTMKSRSFLIPVMLVFALYLGFKVREEMTRDEKQETRTGRDNVRTEIEDVLNQELKLFYPLCLDTTYGGYNNDINYKWQLEGPQHKMIVSQARHVWSLSNAAIFYPGKKDRFFGYASHGYQFLRDIMWDKQSGGFYNLVTRSGEPIQGEGETIKEAYGNAFAIYALAAYYKAFGDTSALGLAKRAFHWMEKHSHDPQYGGYFQFMQRDGTPFPEGFRRTPPKDQNSSIHILECFTELYGVWHDNLLKERLGSLFIIIRDTIVTQKGYMNLFFKRDWTPISYRDSSLSVRTKNLDLDHVSFGHDIETAYLLLEALDKLGINNDTVTLRTAKKMVDHSIINGWDKDNGGIFDGGYYNKGEEDKITIVKETKEFWAQAEALNSLLMMSQLFPEDGTFYYNKFLSIWEYCKKYLIDKEYGGWYIGGIDKAPYMKLMSKANIWKADYHTSRAMINCIRRLDNKKINKHE
jgi:mannobiose 2-epimerase